MIGKTIKDIITNATVKISLPHIEPHEVTNPGGFFYNTDLYVEINDGFVYRDDVVDVAFVCTDGSVFYISTCGCCGGAESPEEAYGLVR